MAERRRRIMLWIPVVLLSAGLLEMALITLDGLTDDTRSADLIVVLGNQVMSDGAPHPRLAARLDAAQSCWERGCAPVILVSGGVGESGYHEAKVMRDYLVERGVDTDAVRVDLNGDTTRHTAVSTSHLMQAEGWSRVIVATQYFHVTRSKLALRQAGVTDVGSVHARFLEWRDAYSLPREALGFWAYLLGARKNEPKDPNE